jgi:arginine/lysine/ornithine decarboxylase
MSSIDLAMKEIEEKGEEFFEKLLKYREKIQRETSKCRFLEVVGINDIEDAAKVMIFVKKHAMTGQRLYDILREDYALQLEMAGEYHALAIITGWDKEEGINRLISAICEIDERLGAKLKEDSSKNSSMPVMNETEISEFEITETKEQADTKQSDTTEKTADRGVGLKLPEVKIPLYKAWDAESNEIEIEKAEGNISAEFINLYPPGIPIVAPGEVFDASIIADIKRYYKEGMNLQGVRIDEAGKILIKLITS